MPANPILSDEQKATLLHTLTFLRLCSIHLESALPVMRDLDEVRAKNLADMAKLCAENIRKYFPESIQPHGGV